jgi:hypothetical protein
MIRYKYRKLILNFLLLLLFPAGISAITDCPVQPASAYQDTLYERQLLYNGRIWKSRYGQVLEHEFFLTENWLTGDVTVNGKPFRNITLRYDLLNDELLAMVNPGTAIILSGEKTLSFVLRTEGKVYRFVNYDKPDSPLIKGYGHLLYSGELSLIVKYTKHIKTLAVENKYDEFYQKQQIFIMRKGELYRIKSKRDLFSHMEDQREKILKYIREKGLQLSIQKPETLVQALQYYEEIITGR